MDGTVGRQWRGPPVIEPALVLGPRLDESQGHAVHDLFPVQRLPGICNGGCTPPLPKTNGSHFRLRRDPGAHDLHAGDRPAGGFVRSWLRADSATVPNIKTH